MGTSTLSRFQRGALAQLVNEGNKSYQVMADALGVAKATISYELDRVKPYDPELAQQDADRKRRNCGRRSMLTATLATLITNHLRLTWSPETIAAAYNLSTASIYNWLNRGKITSGTSIEQRPTTVNQRLAFGHWEVDTVLSSRSESRSCLVTFVERKTRLLWAIKAPNRTAKALNTAFGKFMGAFGPQVKSITVDHGKEFANYQALEQDYQIKVYFCHPYSPWERGSNEYFNRRLRWFFPKKTNFSQVTTDEILAALELINQRPLKIHHQQTAIERFQACSD
ncbi:IS30 family transposase [Companilactobacillus alimentarius]|uniref:IS30 family transposase n=1 Tax=Companilactobacillus alimentarius TaxID=1602 RepID=UPI0028B4FBF4|nr:IS30 family transposase [Companilactobacillus alimentarius]MDT6952226.1 IS30 family transposase [Companilactobacillus alimentarius]